MKIKHQANIKGHILSIQQFESHSRVVMNSIALFKGTLTQCKDIFNEIVNTINELKE